MARDAAPVLIAIARRAGQLTAAEAAAQRDAWIRRWEQRGLSVYRSYLWMHGPAVIAETPDEARAALAELPRFGGVPPYRPRALAEAAVGATYLRAGRLDDALDWLSVAARTCRALDYPIEHTRAHLWLGQAREARGDTRGACAAYRVVIERWGAARPRSVTAEQASERARQIGCSP
jgi:serine/threonine-protein kinase